MEDELFNAQSLIAKSGFKQLKEFKKILLLENLFLKELLHEHLAILKVSYMKQL